MRTMITILLLLIPVAGLPCSGEGHRQFDFWVGSWRVELPDGKLAGTNRISRINGGCALLEEWSGATGTNGKSLNIYDASRKVWHQTWVDSDGTLLVIEGRFENGSMRLGNATDRITWTPLTQGSRPPVAGAVRRRLLVIGRDARSLRARGPLSFGQQGLDRLD